MLLLLSTDGEVRAAVPDLRRRRDPARLRHRRRRPRPRKRSGHRRRRLRLSRPQPGRAPGRRIPRPGPAPPLRDLPPLRRPRRSSCPWTGAKANAGTPLPGNLYSTPRKIAVDPSGTRDGAPRPRPGDPADRAAHGHEVHPPRAHPERAADEVLGTADASRGLPAPARRLRRTPRGPLSPDRLPRPFPLHGRGLPPGAARSRARARLQRALPPRGLQPRPAGIRPRLLQGVDRPRLPPGHRHGDPARQSLLRRLLRRELGQPRALRRRHRPRAHPLCREEIPRPRPGLGAVPLRRLDRRLGVPGGPDLLSGRVQRLLRRLPRPDRLPGLRTGQHLRAPERLPRRRPVEENPAPRPAQLARRGQRDDGGGQPPRAGARHARPLGRPVGHLAGRVRARRRGRLPQADLGQADRGDRPRRRPVLAGPFRPDPYPPARLEDARPQARGQDPHLRRGHGQLLPEQRRVPGRSLPREHEGPLLRRRGPIRRPGRALLERRSRTAQRHLPPPLPPDVHPPRRREDGGHGPAGRGPQELEVLRGRTVAGCSRDSLPLTRMMACRLLYLIRTACARCETALEGSTRMKRARSWRISGAPTRHFLQ
ncbi:MAG: hypothetical protein MZV64_11000 [Ignavibacteriales bacterium]|nr:hypothetical protein [Ignavibacteriales bacterium]